MFRDDEAARAEYLAVLERKAARVDMLESRIRALEAELHQYRELRHAAREPAAAPTTTLSPAPLDEAVDVYVDTKLRDYVVALVRATDPARTEGILSGAQPEVIERMLASARSHAKTANRNHAIPKDVQRAAREHLPDSILLVDTERDPRTIVDAILQVVDVP